MSRRTPRSRACSGPMTPRSLASTSRSAWTWAAWCRPWPDRVVRRIACRSPGWWRTSAAPSRPASTPTLTDRRTTTPSRRPLSRRWSTRPPRSRSRRATRRRTRSAPRRTRDRNRARQPRRLPHRTPTTASTHYRAVDVDLGDEQVKLRSGSVVIAAITSCTNTSNPSVMVAAGLLARNAVARGLRTPGWVKTSLAPGSRAVTDYLEGAGLMSPLEELGFDLVGYGCTTCIGNSGPLAETDRGGDRRQRPGRRGGPVRQSQLRGAHPSAGAGQLPRLAAAGRGVRAGRAHRRGPHHRAAGHRLRWSSPSS